MMVTVVNTGRGPLHIHRAGCMDLAKAYRNAEASWDVVDATLKAIVVDCYEPECFDYDPDTEWNDYTGDFVIKPCASSLPNE